MNLLLAATLLLASVANINADAADMRVPGLRGVDTAAAADGTEETSRRHLQNSLGDWALCTASSQCRNQCCSSKYSSSDGQLKCTPVGGFKPSEGCIGNGPSATSSCLKDFSKCGLIGMGPRCTECCNEASPLPETIGGWAMGRQCGWESISAKDWDRCTNSYYCKSNCCSSKYSDGVLKCTPVGGFKPSEGCVGYGWRGGYY
jgi:hypothetical protein